MHGRQARASDMGAEREHRVWNNLVYLLLAQDYLLDNHIREDWEKRGEREREKHVRRRERGAEGEGPKLNKKSRQEGADS